MKSRPALASCAAVALFAAGCGASARDQVRGKVQEFAVGVAHQDAKTICNDVFAPSLVERFKAAGLTCAHGMQIFFSGLRNPTLAIRRITVHGSRASVVTLSGARGQKAAVRSVNLIHTPNGWRIVSVGGSPSAGIRPGTTTSRTKP